MSEREQELGVTEAKSDNIGEWYAEVVKKAGLADYAPMGGFIVTRPRGYAIWEHIQRALDDLFRRTGVTNAYFPLFIPESYLEREKEVLEGFDPEVAWVTHGGSEELLERLAVRPTSESIIAPFMAEWIRSHRDLPLRLNQWCSVVRWEATETKPFFRTKEFLWQEGHTAHATEVSAWDETRLRLDQYARIYEEHLALPVLRGRKPDHDKFPGARVTTTVEVLMPDGRSVQGGTSHYLGQTFAEAFDVTFVGPDEEVSVVHTTSWGLSWRAIGAVVMAHGDDQGLILPPPVAPTQVAIVPIWQDDTRTAVHRYARGVAEDLEAAGYRVELDAREDRNPGFKFNEHELNGVPLRIEIGPNEVEDETLTLVHRPDRESSTVDRDDLEAAVEAHLDAVYDTLYDRAEAVLEAGLAEAQTAEEVIERIEEQGGYVQAPWCGDPACEEPIKEAVAADIVLVPLDPEEEPIGETCATCGEPAETTAYYAKSY
ncbi:MAG: proline--tRNA ligase [Halobacteriales archaeon]